MPADEASGHENGEPFGYALEYRGDENAAEDESDTVLKNLGGAVQHEGVAHLAEHLLEAALAAPTQVEGGEQHGNEDAGIAGGLGAQGHPVQAEGSEDDADEAGDQSRWDKEVLQQRNAGSDNLSENQQCRHDAHVERQIEGREFHRPPFSEFGKRGWQSPRRSVR